MKDIDMCAGCLATNVRMHSMSDSGLLQTYQLLSGRQGVRIGDVILQRLCWECSALVKKADRFRHKCERAYLLLQYIYSAHNESTQHQIREIDRSRNGLTSPYALSEIGVFSTEMLEKVNRNESIIRSERFDLGKPKISVPEPFIDMKSEDEVDTQDPGIDVQNRDSDDFNETVTEAQSSKCLNRGIDRRITSQKAVKIGHKQKKGKEANSKTTSTNFNAIEILLTPLVTEIPVIMAEQGVSRNTATIKEELVDVSNAIESEQTYNDLRNEPAVLDAVVISTEDDSADVVENVRSQDEAAMKQELDIGLTVLQPSDLHYKRGKAADTTPLTNSIEPHRLHRGHISAVENYESCSDLSSEKTTGNPDAAAETEHGCSNTYSKYVHETSHASDRSESVDVCTEPLLIKSVVKNLKKRIGESMFVCKVCDKHFTRRNHLTMHSKTHTANLCCDICGKVFTTKPNLRRHRTIHASERPYSCDVCSKRYALNRSLTQHKKTHASVRPYGCDICNRYFITKTILRLHLNVHNYERPYSCGVCSKGFKLKEVMKKHERRHNDQSYKCYICSEMFINESLLLKHMSFHDDRRPYRCEVCSKRFTQKKCLQTHMGTHTVERPYSCDICKRRFKLKRNLINHIKNHYDARVHSCNFCSKTFKHGCTLIEHMKIHANESPYSCVDCGKDFTKYCDLKVHIKIHAEKRLYSCGACDKHFTQKSILINHKRIHNGERPYNCVACNKSFAQKFHLRKHEKIHNEGFRYNCDVCSKSCLRKDGLTAHKMLHTGERPYCCNVCGKGFRTKGHLTQHEMIHSTDRPYTCDVCGKRFALKHYLKAHQEFHGNIRPYKCDVCSKRFRRPFNLKEHITKTHPG